MQHSYSHQEHLVNQDKESTPSVTGAWLSIVGLTTWLVAMLMAVAGPLLNINIPASVIVGIVVLSGVLSLLSLPKLLHGADDDNQD